MMASYTISMIAPKVATLLRTAFLSSFPPFITYTLPVLQASRPNKDPSPLPISSDQNPTNKVK